MYSQQDTSCRGNIQGRPAEDEFRYGRYEGAIDGLESMLLAAAVAGIDVQAEPLTTVVQTTLDAIGSNL